MGTHALIDMDTHTWIAIYGCPCIQIGYMDSLYVYPCTQIHLTYSAQLCTGRMSRNKGVIVSAVAGAQLCCAVGSSGVTQIQEVLNDTQKPPN